MTSAASSEKQGTEGRSPPTHSVSYQAQHPIWTLSRMVSAVSHGVRTLEQGEVTIPPPPPKKGTPISVTLTTVRGPWDCSLELVTSPATVERNRNRSRELFGPMCNKGKRGGSTSACERFQEQLGKRTFCGSHTFLTRWPFPRTG